MQIKLLALLVLLSTCFAQTKVKVNKTATGHSVSLSCTVSGNATGCNFYKGTTAGGESTTALNPTPSLTYVDSAVTALSTYFYTAKAYCAACSPNLSPASNEVSAVIPADAQPAAPVLAPPVVAGNKVPLKWNIQNQAGIKVNYFQVFKCHLQNCPSPALAATTNLQVYTDTCNFTDKICYYEVNAHDSINTKNVVSPMSNIVEAMVN
jgi:hypothetical protein